VDTNFDISMVILAYQLNSDSYCWRLLYRYNFHRAHRLKRSCYYKKHALKLKNLNFLLPRVNGTRMNVRNSRDYILKENYPTEGVVCSLLDTSKY